MFIGLPRIQKNLLNTVPRSEPTCGPNRTPQNPNKSTPLSSLKNSFALRRPQITRRIDCVSLKKNVSLLQARTMSHLCGIEAHLSSTEGLEIDQSDVNIKCLLFSDDTAHSLRPRTSSLPTPELLNWKRLQLE
jgi:hypothetical protein